MEQTDDTNGSVDQNAFKNDETILTEEEIEEAKVIITKLHPLYNTPIDKVLPCMSCCCRYCCCCCKSERRK